MNTLHAEEILIQLLKCRISQFSPAQSQTPNNVRALLAHITGMGKGRGREEEEQRKRRGREEEEKRKRRVLQHVCA